MVPHSVYKSRLVIQGVRFLRRNAINDSRFEDLTSKIWLRAGFDYRGRKTPLEESAFKVGRFQRGKGGRKKKKRKEEESFP